MIASTTNVASVIAPASVPTCTCSGSTSASILLSVFWTLASARCADSSERASSSTGP